MLALLLAIFLLSQPVFSNEKKIISDCDKFKKSYPKIKKELKSRICKNFPSFYLSHTESKTEVFSDNLYLDDIVLGIRHPKEKVIRHHYYTDTNIPIYQTSYTLDQYGKRKTPLFIAPNSERNSFVVLLGGSFTFGIGVKDNETIAAYTNKRQKAYQTYNFGVGGTAIHHSIDIINKSDFKEQISQERGIGVYIFIDDHINRVAGRGFWSTVFTDLAYYYLDGEEVVRKKSFRKGNYFFTSVQSFLYKLFNTNFSKMTINKDIKLMCKLALKAKNDFNKNFESNEFYFLFHNFNTLSNKTFIQKELKKCLLKNEVNVLELERPRDFVREDWYFHDNHPMPKTNLYIAKFLINLLNG